MLSIAVSVLVVACQSAAETEDDAAPALVEGDEQSMNILFIGDSFTMGVATALEFFAASAEPPAVFHGEELTRSGTSLAGHWVAESTAHKIENGGWTIVVLQEDLAIEGVDVEKFYEYTRDFDAAIKNTGAETVLYMPWEYDTTNPIRIEQIAGAFREIGMELGIKVAPVGLAWSRAMVERPDLDLYDGDRVHSGDLGLYLTISVLYATIFDETPVGVPFWPEGVEKIGEEDVAFLQRIAWRTVLEYADGN